MGNFHPNLPDLNPPEAPRKSRWMSVLVALGLLSGCAQPEPIIDADQPYEAKWEPTRPEPRPQWLPCPRDTNDHNGVYRADLGPDLYCEDEREERPEPPRPAPPAPVQTPMMMGPVD